MNSIITCLAFVLTSVLERDCAVVSVDREFAEVIVFVMEGLSFRRDVFELVIDGEDGEGGKDGEAK
jgi:hypothetical protein